MSCRTRHRSTTPHDEEIDQKRDRRNGRYTFDGDFDRLCRCGHTLGVHLAEAPHDCIARDFQPGVECDCVKFQPQRRQHVAEQG
jgi:hypothetical protein